MVEADIFNQRPRSSRALHKTGNMGNILHVRGPRMAGNSTGIAGPSQQDRRPDVADFGKTCCNALGARRDRLSPYPALLMEFVEHLRCPIKLNHPPTAFCSMSIGGCRDMQVDLQRNQIQ